MDKKEISSNVFNKILENYSKHIDEIGDININKDETLDKIKYILEKRPLFEKMFTYSGNLLEYAKNISNKSMLLDSYRDENKIGKLVDSINFFSNDCGIKIENDDLSSIVNTGSHFGILSHPMFLGGNLVFSYCFDDNYIIDFAWENVSMNNPSYPRGILLGDKKISLVSNSNKHYNFSDSELVFKSPVEIKKVLDKNIPGNNEYKNIILDGFTNQSNIKKSIFEINTKIGEVIYGKKLIHLPINEIVTKYLIDNMEIFKELFLYNKNNVIDYFDNKYGGFIESNGKVNGTSIGFFVGKNSKYKDSILIDENGYFYTKDDNKIYLSDDDILDGIINGSIQLSLGVIYTTLIDMGILPLGGFNQLDYIKNYINFYGCTTGKDMSDYIISIYMFLGFNFGDINVLDLYNGNQDIKRFGNSQVNGMIDIEFISKMI